MKKIILFLVICAISCTKESDTEKVNSDNVSDSKNAYAIITRTCAPGIHSYHVWYNLSHISSGNRIWLVFSEDDYRISHMIKLQSVNGSGSIYIRHIAIDGSYTPVGKGSVFIIKGARPIKGNVITGALCGSNIDTLDACPIIH